MIMETLDFYLRNFLQLAVFCTLMVVGLRHVISALRRGRVWHQVSVLWALLVVAAGTRWVLAALLLGGAVWVALWLRAPERRRAIHRTIRSGMVRQRHHQHMRHQPSGMVIVEVPVAAQTLRLPAPDPTQQLDLPRRRRVLDEVR
jgi:hypothetical protein